MAATLKEQADFVQMLLADLPETEDDAEFQFRSEVRKLCAQVIQGGANEEMGQFVPGRPLF